MTAVRPWEFLTRDFSDPDGALLAGARQGRQSAFDALRSRHERALRGYIARRVGTDAADDLAQDVWLACWMALPRFAGRSRFKAWLYGIAAHKCMDYLRSRAQDGRRLESLQGVDAPALDQYAASDLRQCVRDIMLRLPDAQREVLELYYDAGLTLAEIGQALGRNLNTVKYQFYRAHDQVGRELKNEGVSRP